MTMLEYYPMYIHSKAGDRQVTDMNSILQKRAGNIFQGI